MNSLSPEWRSVYLTHKATGVNERFPLVPFLCADRPQPRGQLCRTVTVRSVRLPLETRWSSHPTSVPTPARLWIPTLNSCFEKWILIGAFCHPLDEFCTNERSAAPICRAKPCAYCANGIKRTVSRGQDLYLQSVSGILSESARYAGTILKSYEDDAATA